MNNYNMELNLTAPIELNVKYTIQAVGLSDDYDEYIEGTLDQNYFDINTSTVCRKVSANVNGASQDIYLCEAQMLLLIEGIAYYISKDRSRFTVDIKELNPGRTWDELIGASDLYNSGVFNSNNPIGWDNYASPSYSGGALTATLVEPEPPTPPSKIKVVINTSAFPITDQVTGADITGDDIVLEVDSDALPSDVPFALFTSNNTQDNFTRIVRSGNAFIGDEVGRYACACYTNRSSHYTGTELFVLTHDKVYYMHTETEDGVNGYIICLTAPYPEDYNYDNLTDFMIFDAFLSQLYPIMYGFYYNGSATVGDLPTVSLYTPTAPTVDDPVAALKAKLHYLISTPNAVDTEPTLLQLQVACSKLINNDLYVEVQRRYLDG